MMDIHAILKQLPHRYPFLLVDKVIELESNTRIKAIKNVTFNEPYFMGHFPGHPVMPGVLILEALAQAAGLLAFDAMGKVPDENNIYYFVGIDGARFKRPVEPGDQLILEITIDRVELITRAELMRRNTRHNLPPELNALISTKARLTRLITEREKRNEKQD